MIFLFFPNLEEKGRVTVPKVGGGGNVRSNPSPWPTEMILSEMNMGDWTAMIKKVMADKNVVALRVNLPDDGPWCEIYRV